MLTFNLKLTLVGSYYHYQTEGRNFCSEGVLQVFGALGCGGVVEVMGSLPAEATGVRRITLCKDDVGVYLHCSDVSCLLHSPKTNSMSGLRTQMGGSLPLGSTGPAWKS